jgi:NAD-dependent SIR2 family protein deacetylase
MAQIFPPRANAFLKLILTGLAAGIIIGGTALVQYNWSSWNSETGIAVSQPVPFSHEHHVSGLGIDCRYCHASVEASSSAGMPSTHTCMSCHSQLWTESDMLRPVRTSYRTNQPIQWNRVYNLPDYVYFNHSIHVNTGVGCETCHGRVDQMPLIRKASTLYMKWCLDCHRAPEQFLRPQQYIYAFGYDLPEEAQRTVGQALIEQFDINVGSLDNCSICHR